MNFQFLYICLLPLSRFLEGLQEICRSNLGRDSVLVTNRAGWVSTSVLFFGASILLGPVPKVAASPELQAGQSLASQLATNSINSQSLSLSIEGINSRVGKVLSLPVESASFTLTRAGAVNMNQIPSFTTAWHGRFAGVNDQNEYAFFSLQPRLQKQVEQLISKIRAAHVAVVAMDPKSGRVLAMADRSNSIPNMVLYSGFPTASVFKLITTAAGLERRVIEPRSEVRFRGSNYTLTQANYEPNSRLDHRSMSVAEALGRSCNPVFGRIALRYLSPGVLQFFANSFGFNSRLPFDLPLKASSAEIPSDDFGLSRTGAGFGATTMSPIHAATLVSGVANNGLLPRPILIDEVRDEYGHVIYEAEPTYLKRMISPATSKKLLEMMENTTTMGTSRKDFNYRNHPLLPGIRVAAKTGTLDGDYPTGINHWFVGAAPIERPEIAIAVIVVGPSSMRASSIGREVIEAALKQ